MIQHNIEFGGAGGNGCTRFSQLGIGVLRAFMEAYDAGYENIGAFKIGEAALYPIQTNAYRLSPVSGGISLIESDGLQIEKENQ